ERAAAHPGRPALRRGHQPAGRLGHGPLPRLLRGADARRRPERPGGDGCLERVRQGGHPIMERQLSWLRRKLEYNTFQLIVEHVENAAGAAASPATRLPAVCLLHLSGYTALPEEIGDQAAAERAGTLGTLVQELANGHGGRVVKLLGDGGDAGVPRSLDGGRLRAR